MQMARCKNKKGHMTQTTTTEKLISFDSDIYYLLPT